MDKDKYVKIKHVNELIKLIELRDRYQDWSDEYEKANQKVENTVDWIRRNAKEID